MTRYIVAIIKPEVHLFFKEHQILYVNKKEVVSKFKKYQIEPVEIDNFLNFEVDVMFRQAANDMYYKNAYVSIIMVSA